MSVMEHGLATTMERIVGGVCLGSMRTEEAQARLTEIHGSLQQWEQRVATLASEGPGANLFGVTVDALQQLSHAALWIEAWLANQADDSVKGALYMAYRAQQQLSTARLHTSDLVEQILDDES